MTHSPGLPPPPPPGTSHLKRWIFQAFILCVLAGSDYELVWNFKLDIHSVLGKVRYCKDILLSTVLTSISPFFPIHFSFLSHLFLFSFAFISPFFRIHFCFLSHPFLFSFASISPSFRIYFSFLLHPFLLSCAFISPFFRIHFSFLSHQFLLSFAPMDFSMSSTYASDPYSFHWEYMHTGGGGVFQGFSSVIFFDAGSFSVYSFLFQLFCISGWSWFNSANMLRGFKSVKLTSSLHQSA